jgi:hypothetical protein
LTGRAFGEAREAHAFGQAGDLDRAEIGPAGDRLDRQPRVGRDRAKHPFPRLGIMAKLCEGRGVKRPCQPAVVLRRDPGDHVDGVAIPARHEVGMGVEPARPHRELGVQRDRTVGQFRPLLRIAEARTPGRVEGQDLGCVRRHRDGPVHRRLAPREVTAHSVAHPDDRMGLGIRRVERDGALRRGMGDGVVALLFDPEVRQHAVGVEEFDPGAGEAGVEFDGAVQVDDRRLEVGDSDAFQLLGPEKVEFVGREVGRGLAVGGDAPGLLHEAGTTAERVADLFGDLGLDGEDIRRGPVPARRPERGGVGGPDKLGGDPDPALVLEDGSGHGEARLQFVCESFQVGCCPGIGPCRIAGEHAEFGKACEVGDDVLGQPGRDSAFRVMTADRLEGQHGDEGYRLGLPDGQLPGKGGERGAERECRCKGGAMHSACARVGRRFGLDEAVAPARNRSQDGVPVVAEDAADVADALHEAVVGHREAGPDRVIKFGLGDELSGVPE